MAGLLTQEDAVTGAALPAASETGSRPRANPSHPRGLLLLCWFLGSLLLGFVILPLAKLGLTPSASELVRAAGMAEVREALAVSLEAAFLTAAIAAIAGVPLAYLLVRGSFPGKAVVAALIDLPLAVPHTVAGMALLMVLGRQGILGAPAERLLGVKFWGTLSGVVAAMVFVAAPYTVNAARIAFDAVDPRLEKVARTLGLGPWRTVLHVSLPLAWRGILAGITLTLARSISEFGAVVIIAYYPMTAPVRIYEMFLRFGLDDAAAAAVLLLAVSLSLFLLLRGLARGRTPLGAGR